MTAKPTMMMSKLAPVVSPAISTLNVTTPMGRLSSRYSVSFHVRALNGAVRNRTIG